MGLFEKKITFVTTEDEDFRVYVGKKDISDDIGGIWWFRSDHMLVYDENSGTTYILYNMKDAVPGETHEGGVFAETHTLLFVRDANRNFDLYYEGISIAYRVVFCDIDDDLWLYDPLEENTFVLPSYESIDPDVVAATLHAGSRPDDGFCFRRGETNFAFVYRGVDYTTSFVGMRLDPDVLFFVPEVDRMFLVRDALHLKQGEWKEDHYSDVGSNPFVKITGNGSYFAVYQGKDITSATRAFRVGDDFVLYAEETNSYYRVKDGAVTKPGGYQVGSLYAENCSAMWRGDGRKLEIYYKGRLITDEVQLQRMGDDGIAMHESSQSMLHIEGMINHTDNVFRGIPG